MEINGIYNNPVNTNYPNGGVEDAPGAQGNAPTGGVNRASDQIIIDVKTGEASIVSGLDIDIIGKTKEITYDDLTPSQKQDVDRLLALLGLDAENAKDASALTILKAIQKHIKAQSIVTTTSTQALSDYDVERLNALKKAMQPLADAGDENAQKIIDNVDRLMVLKAEIEDLANNKGMKYDGKFEGENSPNFDLNTRIREMGDRYKDICTYRDWMGGDKLNAALDKLAPSMAKAVKDLIASYDEASRSGGWGDVTVVTTYSKSVKSTISSFLDVLKSSDLKLPDQIDRDALVKMLEKLMDCEDGPEKIEEMLEKMIEELEAAMAQMEVVEVPQTV